MCGHPELAARLTKLGSPPPAYDRVDALIAAALVADRKSVERFAENLDEVRAQRPALIVWAASLNRPAAVELLAELGWDVNARGRTDIPMEQRWETALHEAAGSGNAELTRRLLKLGADPDIEDTRFRSTPLGWARHFEQPATIHILGPVTTRSVNPD
jgi:ankyrin repeat protein